MPTQLFVNACNAYQIWLNTGKDARNHWQEYEAWDAAVEEFAKAIGKSRSVACLYVFDAVRTEV